MHTKDILKTYNIFVKDLDKKLKEAQNRPFYYYSYDFNRIKYLAFYNEDKQFTLLQNPQVVPYSTIQGTQVDDLTIWYRNFITIDYKGGYSEVIEYWEDDRFVLMIDGRIMTDGPNPLPVKKKPYYEIHYNKIPGIPFGQGMSLTMSDIQHLADTIFNLTIDNIKLQVAPMFQKVKGGDVFADGETTLTYEPFKVWETNMPNAIQRLDLGTPDFTGINIMDYLFKIGEMTEGVNSYSVGYQNKVERSATGVTALVQASKASLLPLIDSLNVALSKIAYLWTTLAIIMMKDTVEVKVIDKDNAASFKEINIADLEGDYDIEFDAQALKTATRETRRKQYMDLLSLAPTAGTDPITGQYMINMKEIWRQVCDSFELPPETVLLDDKAVVQRQINFDKTKQKMMGKYQAGQGYQPQYGGEFQSQFGGFPTDQPAGAPEQVDQSSSQADVSFNKDQKYINGTRENQPEGLYPAPENPNSPADLINETFGV